MAHLLLTVVGDDREGLVTSLASLVAENQGNWLESQMARMGGRFAGIVMVDVADDHRAALEAAVTAMPELRVRVEDAGADAPQRQRFSLHVVGNDRPGILREVSSALTAQGVGIEELSTYVRPAPMADTTLFHATATCDLPQGTSAAQVREALEAITHDLMVDLDFVTDYGDEADESHPVPAQAGS